MPDQKLSIKKLKVVAFDWDNTLACTREALCFSVNKILPRYGLPQWDEVKKLRDDNLSFRDNFPRIFGDKAEQAYSEYREVYKQNAERLIKVPEMALETVEFLHKKGIILAIVSNKDRLLLDYELPMLYDDSLFDVTVCGHEAPRDKPHPEQLLFALQKFKLEVSAETVWMVGDSQMDSNCALAAGVKAIRIGKSIWGDQARADETDVLFVDDFRHFYRLLTE